MTCSEFLAEVQAVAKGLMAAGIGAGDRVGLMSKTRYEWTLIDFAIWTAGAVTVPIYETSSAEQVAVDPQRLRRGRVLRRDRRAPGASSTRSAATLADLDNVWRIDDGGRRRAVRRRARVSPTTSSRTGARRCSPDDLATIIYTSGTTGRPKGCELTHGNFLVRGRQRHQRQGLDATLANVFQDESASTLLFLPLAHVFARMIQVGVRDGPRPSSGHTADIKNLLADLATFRPTFILSVPRVFEKVYNSAEQKAEADGKGKIFHAAADTAIAYSEALDHGGPGLGAQGQARASSTSSSTASCGPRSAAGCAYAVSGGAPLGARLGHFFRGIGLTDPRGLRPDRDHRRLDREHARA